ncbi:hypothetical protein QAD02_021571 [Eretmocerus hayati]|uniref:Uncharacterized protein n=1 Tax=Eretmocerus hayati TaxID=131215 RepID=A0ACC2PQN1_9HYME|nr:hypothetical protein QAD02_021571 [Eretmocerus hayati]
MDEFVKTKLSDWQLQNFVEKFETSLPIKNLFVVNIEAGIDQEMFNDLDDCMVDSLIDSKAECGYNKKFKKRFEAYKNSMKLTDNASNNSSKSNVSDRTPFKDLTNTAQNSRQELPIHVDHVEESSLNSPNEGNQDSHEVSRVIRIIPHRLNVKALLHKTHRGFVIRMEFKNLGNVNFRLLCALLIDYEFEFTGKYRIAQERFGELSDESAHYFVVEPAQSAGSTHEIDPESVKKLEQQRADFKAILFYPRKKATLTDKCVAAGGAVYEKYLYDRKTLIRIGAIQKHEILVEDLTAQEQENDLQIIRTKDEPKKRILEIWTEQFPNRAHPSNYKNHFELYKPLRSYYGHECWKIDYDILYPNGIDFDVVWSVVAPFVIAVAKERSKFDKSLQALESRGQIHLAALLSLPILLGRRMPKPNEQKGKKRKSAEAQPNVDHQISEVESVPLTFGLELQDIYDSFIYNAESPTAFSDFKNRRKNDSVINRRPVGPFITIVGDYANEGKIDGENQVEVFVTVNDIDYKIASNKVLEAVDTCYKSFKSCNIDFPVESRPVWTFLFYYIYQNNWDSIKRGSAFRKFIEDVDSKRMSSQNVTSQVLNVEISDMPIEISVSAESQLVMEESNPVSS